MTLAGVELSDLMDWSWGIAVVEPDRDFSVEHALRREGYRSVFLYYRKLLTGHRGDWRKTHAFVSRPLFSGYGFVQLWPGQDYPDPARVKGFARLLMAGGSPLILGDAKVCEWQERAQAGEFDDRRPESKKPGAKYLPANSEDERKRVLGELADQLGSRYAVAS